MKKTNEKATSANSSVKRNSLSPDYHDDLNRILEKYNEKGYRDARIISDSVANYNDKTVDVYITLDEGKRYYIKDIQWVGQHRLPHRYA